MASDPTALPTTGMAPIDAGVVASECRRDMVEAARSAILAAAPAEVADVLAKVPVAVLTTRIAGAGEEGRPRTRFAVRADHGQSVVEVALAPDTEGLTDGQLAAFATVAALCHFARPQIPGASTATREGQLLLAGARRSMARMLCGGVAPVPALDVAKLAKLPIGDTSPVARGIRAAAEAQNGRPFGRAVAAEEKRTGGSLFVAEKMGEKVRKVDVKGGKDARLVLMARMGRVIELRALDVDSGDSVTLACGRLGYRWNAGGETFRLGPDGRPTPEPEPTPEPDGEPETPEEE